MRRRILEGGPGQSIFDGTLEVYGSLDGLSMLVEDNQPVINEITIEGLTLKVRDTYTDKVNVNELFSKRKPVSY